ncbi:YggT family protein [Ornithinimicrobium cryptoxanthini]|uniref:YggT family protein n=1 Tax=Ornithinimicrobium cryptoxanthini TaxID=2934161 RepID=A0ABY4YL94_9MICO|nr:YggT family protein [Ornithinimicrobium cryptoxanthini]USQ77483.1 YggT family protein [Ornithinimicrobium cryptoxanthini]
MIATILFWLLNLYFFVLIIRLILDWVQVFSRDWRPSGVMLIVAETVYSLTDPPIRFLRRFIPPLRLGGVALDLAFLVLILLVSIGRRLVLEIPF